MLKTSSSKLLQLHQFGTYRYVTQTKVKSPEEPAFGYRWFPLNMYEFRGETPVHRLGQS